jgi:hypothetical protein
MHAAEQGANDTNAINASDPNEESGSRHVMKEVSDIVDARGKSGLTIRNLTHRRMDMTNQK